MKRNDEQHGEREFEGLVDRMKREHHVPPEAPRDRMWERIEAARAEQRTDGSIVRPDFGARSDGGSGRWWRLAAAAVTILVLGISVGRMLPGPDGQPMPVAEQVAPPAETVEPSTAPTAQSDPLVRLAAVELFGRADALLTGFRTQSCDSKQLEPVPGWASDMLVRTRLLLGASASISDAEGGALKDLLLELELVLVQIAGLSGEDCRQETEWIRSGLEKRSTVERLRLAAATGTERPL